MGVKYSYIGQSDLRTGEEEIDRCFRRPIRGGESVVRINGQDCEKTGISVSDYLEQENYNVKHIVVEYNLEIIPKERYAQTILKDGDEVEIVSFMGGGSK